MGLGALARCATLPRWIGLYGALRMDMHGHARQAAGPRAAREHPRGMACRASRADEDDDAAATPPTCCDLQAAGDG